MMRARPFFATRAHCPVTFTRSGARRPAVVQTRFTSRPAASAVSELHSRIGPSSSVTLRDDRAFLREVATQVWAFAGDRLTDFDGPFVEWEEERKRPGKA